MENNFINKIINGDSLKELKKIPRLLGVKGKIRFYRHKKGEKKIHHVTWL
jgi:hypothetical protein